MFARHCVFSSFGPYEKLSGGPTGRSRQPAAAPRFPSFAPPSLPWASIPFWGSCSCWTSAEFLIRPAVQQATTATAAPPLVAPFLGFSVTAEPRATRGASGRIPLSDWDGSSLLRLQCRAFDVPVDNNYFNEWLMALTWSVVNLSRVQVTASSLLIVSYQTVDWKMAHEGTKYELHFPCIFLLLIHVLWSLHILSVTCLQCFWRGQLSTFAAVIL